MTFEEFTAIVEKQPDGVILLEGRRSIPDADARMATNLARRLAQRYPRLKFRSGNATGTDDAFSAGVAQVDASRLQVIAPYPSHRTGFRYPNATYDSPKTLTEVQEAAAIYKTVEASPYTQRLIEMRGGHGPLGAKANYLIRDTMKVLGHSIKFPRPICALFFIDQNDSMAGGTGHTIRVCQQEGVRYAFQDSWQLW
jgi:hypothetical protein